MGRKKKRKNKKDASSENLGFWGFWVELYGRLWRILFTGFMLWLPLIVTLWLSWWVFNKVIFGIERGINELIMRLHGFAEKFPQFSFLNYINYHAGFGILLSIGIFLVTGYLARHWLGRRLIAYGDRILHSVPVFNRIYQAVTQIRDVIVKKQGAMFEKVCLVEYPRKGMMAVAFVTSREQGMVQRTLGKEMIAIFIPTTPNPGTSTTTQKCLYRAGVTSIRLHRKNTTSQAYRCMTAHG